MREIKVQQLSDEGFRKYGVYQNLLDNESMASRTFPSGGFYADLVSLDFGGQNLPTISICHIKKSEKNIVDFLEYHQNTCEGLLPMDDDEILFTGLQMRGDLTTENLEAFYVPQGTFVKMNPMVVHGMQFPVHNEEAHVVCMLPGRTFHNDVTARRIEDDLEKAVLV